MGTHVSAIVGMALSLISCAHPRGEWLSVRSAGAGSIGSNSSLQNSHHRPAPISVSVGSMGHTCFLMSDGHVFCAGSNRLGALGVPDLNWSSTPERVEGLRDVVQVETGDVGVSCARTRSGSVYCWGNNHFSMIGTAPRNCDRCGDVSCCRTPVMLPDIRGARDLAIGPTSVCVIDGDASLWCWGSTNLPSTLDDAPIPRRISAVGDVIAVRAIATGWLLQRRDGTWINTDPEGSPIPSGSVLAEGPAGYHMCFFSGEMQVRCIGRNDFGQLGLGPTELLSSSTPAALNVEDVRAIADGKWHSCALTRQGAVYCWGENRENSLGSTTGERCPGVQHMVDCVRTPRRVEGVDSVRSIFAGHGVTWMIDDRARLWVLDSGTFGSRGIVTRYPWP